MKWWHFPALVEIAQQSIGLALGGRQLNGRIRAVAGFSTLMYHLWETRLKLRILGLGRTKNVAELTEDAAVDLGAEMLGELLMFSFGALILGIEYRRGARKEAIKEERVQRKFDDLVNQINELTTLMEIQDARMRGLTRSVALKKSD
ncbi:unnamed protein product [Calicophoron daubneyi]|uniref:Optic atrophy 3 protein n=1 Tax=Calicophoron daubneyi TaxID=300641 RepID=A0AAV2THK6_CALDB